MDGENASITAIAAANSQEAQQSLKDSALILKNFLTTSESTIPVTGGTASGKPCTKCR